MDIAESDRIVGIVIDGFILLPEGEAGLGRQVRLVEQVDDRYCVDQKVADEFRIAREKIGDKVMTIVDWSDLCPVTSIRLVKVDDGRGPVVVCPLFLKLYGQS